MEKNKLNTSTVPGLVPCSLQALSDSPKAWEDVVLLASACMFDAC